MQHLPVRLPGASETLKSVYFTRRESEYLLLLKGGARPKEMSSLLGVSADTARKRVISLYRGLNLGGVIELVSWINAPDFAPALDGIGVIWPHPIGCKCGLRWCQERAG